MGQQDINSQNIYPVMHVYRLLKDAQYPAQKGCRVSVHSFSGILLITQWSKLIRDIFINAERSEMAASAIMANHTHNPLNMFGLKY